MAPKDFNNTAGLCGTYDNNIDNDLRTRDGYMVELSQATTHYAFSDSWEYAF